MPTLNCLTKLEAKYVFKKITHNECYLLLELCKFEHQINRD